MEKSGAAPDKEELAEHFATKMSNGAEDSADHYKPKDNRRVNRRTLLNFKIQFKRVRRCLERIDSSKASNGVGNPFLKEFAQVIAPAIDSLFKFIEYKSVYPSDWKGGAIAAAHKRGSVKLCKNYRPIQVLNNLSSIFEDTVSP